MHLSNSARLGNDSQYLFSVNSLFKYFLMPFQCFGTILLWSTFAAYQGAYIFLAIGLCVLVHCLALETFVFGWNEKEKVFDAMLCGETKENWKSRSQDVFRKAVMTSWLAPLVDWHLSDVPQLIRSARKINRKSFVIVSTWTHYLFVSFVFLFLCLMNQLDMNNFTAENAPITHCFPNPNSTKELKANQTAKEEPMFKIKWSDWKDHNVWSYWSDWNQRINAYDHGKRWCSPNEEPTSFFTKTFVWVILTSLIVGFVARCLNVQTENYNKLEPSRRRHPQHSVPGRLQLQNQISSAFYNRLRSRKAPQGPSKALHLDYCTNCKVTKARKRTIRRELNKQNMVDGGTCLHLAFQKGMFKDCLEMIKSGADPFQRDAKGNSVASWILNPICKNYNQKRSTWLGEAYLESMMLRSFQNDQPCGICYLSDSEGRIIWSAQFEDKEELVIANCLVNQAVLVVEWSDKIRTDETLFKYLKALKGYFSEYSKDDFLQLKTNILIANSSEEPHEVAKGCLGIYKKLADYYRNPPLHKAIKEENFERYDVLISLGANPRAKNVEGQTPLEAGLKHFKGSSLEEASQEKLKVIWKILVRGGVQYLKGINDLTRTSNEIKFVLETFPPDDSNEKLHKEFAGPLFLHAVRLQGEHPAGEQLSVQQPTEDHLPEVEQLQGHQSQAGEAEEQSQEQGNVGNSSQLKMDVNFFLSLGCDIRTTRDGDGNTVLHLAAQHPTPDCLRELLV